MPDLDRMVAGLRCRDLLTLLPDYVDHELDEQERARVDAHLQGCEHCAKFGGEYGALVEELKRHRAEPELALGIRDRLADRMEAVWNQEGGSHDG